ncbi:carbohydrate ABC transporter permease [Sinorhizobium meliloti]|uniref:carbohydrate ABC transporter permease n=1 Tax=Rhizobium meliloti TaxID=382 RepID=UPI000FD6F51F|nr:sugar ABC transporter permease [Sinorhizobium meliloti]MCO6424534.1 sugar ABC transporter permease [Sinorhizobium meliloti]MDX1047487.1 ABC transporter permease subunit [Sinorhizobium medicae]RVL30742.1 sugar ABC transporter permease [Sinorhizobium meliloti]
MTAITTKLWRTPHGAVALARGSEMMALWCTSPAIVLMLATTLAPFCAVLVLSLTDYELGDLTLSWIGLANFARAIRDPEVRQAVANTFVFAGMVVPSAVCLALFFALLVNSRTKSRRLYELAFFLPITATMPVMSLVWSFLLHDRIGPITTLLQFFGVPTVQFFSNPTIILGTLAVIAVWQHMGFCFIIFLAGLTTVPAELYEAAALDGADRGWEKFRRITWPHVAPTALVAVLLTTMRTFQVFELVAVLTQGGPAGRSQVILYKTYLEAFSYFRVGYGSALTLIFVTIVGTISLIQLTFARRNRAA